MVPGAAGRFWRIRRVQYSWLFAAELSRRFECRDCRNTAAAFLIARFIVKNFLWLCLALSCIALTAPAQEDGVRDILFANPLVRWKGTIHKKGPGNLWVFYCGNENIRVIVPEGTSPRGFLVCKRVANRAVLSWLEAQSKPDSALSRRPDEMPPSPQMQTFTDRQNKILGHMFSYTPIGTSRINGETYWRFHIKSNVASYNEVIFDNP